MIGNIVDWWRNFFEHPTFWDAFWPSVLGALTGAVAGAYLAFRLERDDRQRARLNQETGLCNSLLFNLGRMRNRLADIHQQMFVDLTAKHGRPPKWNEIGALAGLPREKSESIVGDYAFLLEDRARGSSIAILLGRVYVAEDRYRALLSLIHERNDLWYRVP